MVNVQATGHLVEEMVDELPDGVVVCDTDGLLVYANRRLEELTGYSRSELLGKPVESLVPARLRTAHHRHRADYQSAPRPCPMGAGLETLLLRSDGSEIPVDIVLGPASNGRGQFVIGTVRDARERRDVADRLQLGLERERIARELLAGVIHSMFAIGLALQAAAGIAGNNGVAHRIEACVAEVDACISQMRQHVFDLRDEAPVRGATERHRSHPANGASRGILIDATDKGVVGESSPAPPRGTWPHRVT